MSFLGFRKKNNLDKSQAAAEIEAMTQPSSQEEKKKPETSLLSTKEDIFEVIKTCYDPKIDDANIYDLGYIYSIDVDESGVVNIKMTLPYPNSPSVQSLIDDVEFKVGNTPGVKEVKLEVEGREVGKQICPTKEDIIKAIKTCYDPEIPIDVYELGLIYSIDIDDSCVANIKMTLTTPNCPAAQYLPAEVKSRVHNVAGIEDVELEIVWTPAWTPDLMSDAARLELGIF